MKRFLSRSLVMAACLLLCLLPAWASAEEVQHYFQLGEKTYATLAEAQAALTEDGQTITLLADYEHGKSSGLYLDAPKNYTLDLNGKTLSIPEWGLTKYSSATCRVYNGYVEAKIGIYTANGLLILEDVHVNARGSIFWCARGNIEVISGSYCTQGYDGQAAIRSGSYEPGVVCISSGTFSTERGWCFDSGVALDPQSTSDPYPWVDAKEVRVFPLPAERNSALESLSYRVGEGETIAVDGFNPIVTEYEIVLPARTSATAKISLIGETLETVSSIAANEGVTLSEGEGTAALTVRSQDGSSQTTYAVRFRTLPEQEAVFESGGLGYASLEEALARLSADGQVVTLLRDSSTSYTCDAARPYALDLNGYTIRGLRQSSAATRSHIYNGSVYFEGNDAIAASAGEMILEELYVYGSHYVAVRVTENARVEIRSGTYEGGNRAVAAARTALVRIHSGVFSRFNDAPSGCLSEGIVYAEGSSSVPESLTTAASGIVYPGSADGNASLKGLSYRADDGPLLKAVGFSGLEECVEIVLPYGTDPAASLALFGEPLQPDAVLSGSEGIALADGEAVATLQVKHGDAERSYTVRFSILPREGAFFGVSGFGFATLEAALFNLWEDGQVVALLQDYSAPLSFRSLSMRPAPIPWTCRAGRFAVRCLMP